MAAIKLEVLISQDVDSALPHVCDVLPLGALVVISSLTGKHWPILIMNNATLVK